MLEGVLDVLHYLFVTADVHIVVQANQRIRLVVNRPHRLLGADHEREHLGVAIGIVKARSSPADLPGAEEFGRIVVQGTETVDGCFGKFFSGCSPYFLESGFQISLRIVWCAQRYEFAVRFQQVIPAGFGAIAFYRTICRGNAPSLLSCRNGG